MANSTTQFGGFLTNVGVALQANSAALGLPWSITHMLIGDAGGEPSQTPDPTPSPAQSALVRRVYRAPLNALYKSPADPNVLVAELVLPPEIGGWWIRELGLEDADGNFIAVAKPPPSYKPLLQQGSGRTQTIRMHVVFGNVANINLKIDPSIVLATRDYVDKAREAAELYARNQVKAHAEAADPHPQYLRRADVAKDAGPLAWLGAAAGTADALVLTLKSSEAVLPAYAAGQRFQFQAVATNTGAVTAKINGRAAVAVKKSGGSGLLDLVGGEIQAGALYDLNYDGTYFQLGGGVGGSSLPVGSIVPFPKGTVPPGFLELDGSVQSIATYPDLSAYLGTTYNKGDEGAGFFRLPDSRGEFLRGWDHGRGVDAGRALGSWQDEAFKRHKHDAPGWGNSSSDSTGGTYFVTADSGGSYTGDISTMRESGGTETRPRNIAVMWCIKVWNAPVNQGNIDVAALAAQVAVSMPKRYRSGFGMSINAASPANTVDVAPGVARGSGNSVELLSTMSGVLQSAGAWSPGTGGNKLDAAARAPNSWYHRFILRRIAGGEADLLFSLSLAPAVPVGYEIIMRAGSVLTGADGNVVPFIDVGRERFWSAPIKEGAGSYASSGSFTQTLTLTVPRGVRVLVRLQIAFAGAAVNMYLRPTDSQPAAIYYITGVSAAAVAAWGVGMTLNTYTSEQNSQAFEVLTDATGSVVMQSYATDGFYSIVNLGYVELD